MAIFAALIGLVGTIYGFLSYKWSKETAKNVAHIGINAQLSIAEDFVQELYRRIVFAKAMILEPNKVTPNTISTLKLPAFSDYFQVGDYKTNEKPYILLLEIKQRVIDYNNTIDICIPHIEKTNCLSEKDNQDLERKAAKILQRVVRLCEQLEGNSSFGERTLIRIAHLHINHLRCDGYPEQASLNQYIENNSDNLVYSSTVDSICSRFTEWSSTLMNLMKQEPHNCLNEFSQGDIQSQDIVNWFCLALLIDAAIEIKKIS